MHQILNVETIVVIRLGFLSSANLRLLFCSPLCSLTKSSHGKQTTAGMTENQYLIIGLRLSLWQTVTEPTDVNDSSDVLARPFSTKQREKASKTKWLFCAQPHPEPGSTCRVQANIPDR
ncbi:BEACH domain-containing protein lvsC [Trichinella spiralis]|uniref:BEACH domain-containing protein lvsC n=1 Tax=Trichinella spiralis TaxID=6334 RepID=A0ABR3KPB8_TRISP